jgi:hypothetical protein
MKRKGILSLTEADHALLMRMTAEMLAVPFRACLHRDCRRSSACRYQLVRTGEPHCLARLNATEKDAFDQLLDLVIYIADAIHIGTPAHSVDVKACEEAAIEIVLAARRSNPEFAYLFPPWLARYRAAEAAAQRVQEVSHA